ncbi:stage III sporulation protein AF [Paenibacillus sp. TRM 82003]|nr:stage III sporulation protein AF [Paenibacillus sp. TRM 82003]
MEALGDWLRQIILVVLLATFVDLLLPNRTMQRYVRLVVSLFILMTILSPVLQLFGSNASLRMLAATVDGWTLAGTQPAEPSGTAAANGHSIPALGEVLSEGEAMKRSREEQSLRLLESKLESMVVDHVRTQHDIAEATAEAKLALDADGMPVIRGIRIFLGGELETLEAFGDDGRDASAAGGLVEPVKPIEIEPVHVEPVRIGEGREGEAAAREPPASAAASPGREASLDASYDAKAIALSVAKAWSVSPAIVKVERRTE